MDMLMDLATGYGSLFSFLKDVVEVLALFVIKAGFFLKPFIFLQKQ